MKTTGSSVFSDKVRVRVCGLLVQSNAVLLAKIHSPVTNKLIWTPPGGGLNFGESLADCLKREFKEETNMQINVQELRHLNELISPPFHALECYFEVEQTGGALQIGTDPELEDSQQLLQDLQWIDLSEVSHISVEPKNLVGRLQRWEDRSSFSIVI